MMHEEISAKGGGSKKKRKIVGGEHTRGSERNPAIGKTSKRLTTKLGGEKRGRGEKVWKKEGGSKTNRVTIFGDSKKEKQSGEGTSCYHVGYLSKHRITARKSQKNGGEEPQGVARLCGGGALKTLQGGREGKTGTQTTL